MDCPKCKETPGTIEGEVWQDGKWIKVKQPCPNCNAGQIEKPEN